MKKGLKKILLPIGLIFVLTLIGILILSSLLYYRSIKVQRFLEPALAISEPRLKFGQSINNLISENFLPDEKNKIKYKSSALIVSDSLLFSNNGSINTEVVKKLSKFFVTALGNQDIKKYISLILVSIRVAQDKNKIEIIEAFNKSRKILDLLFFYEPQLKKEYINYFSSSIILTDKKGASGTMIEFRIVPSEQLHIDVLQRLIKYAE
jgi:uncharacterized membrane-anchored protein YjiN (DUF445 family)